MNIPYLRFARIAPSNFRALIRKNGRFAGLADPDTWLGQAILLSILLSIVGFLSQLILLGNSIAISLLTDLVVGFGTIFVYYMHMYYSMEDRRKRVEKVLPDLLQIIAANMRAGMSPIIALRAAARPEFGPLEDEIKYVTTKSLGTESFTQALQEISSRFNSEVFKRTVQLFVASLRSGGHLAQLLENTASDVRGSQELRDELISATRMYTLLIGFVVVLGTPLLLAVSIQFVEMVGGLQSSTSAGGVPSELAFAAIQAPLSQEFLNQTSLAIIIANGILTSLLIGAIQEGKLLSGLKYGLVMVAVSAAFFFVARDQILPLILNI